MGQRRRGEGQYAAYPWRGIEDRIITKEPVDVLARAHDDEENVDHGKDSQILTRGILEELLTQQNTKAQGIADGAPHEQARIEDSREEEAKIDRGGGRFGVVVLSSDVLHVR